MDSKSHEFDWSGAPKGERYRRDYGDQGWEYYVIKVNDEVVFWDWAERVWDESSYTADDLRRLLAFERVEPARQELRDEVARPPVRVGDRVRVTIEGKVLDAREDGLMSDAFEISVGGEGRRFFWPSNDGAQVEVLQRADPPLEPGELVRDGAGAVWQYYGEMRGNGDRFAKVVNADGSPAACGGLDYGRLTLPGPLVKVELREVPDEQ